MPMIQGKAFWAKIVGEPVEGYTKGPLHREWTMDVSLDKKAVAELKKLGVGEYIKNKGNDLGDFICFKRKAIGFDGTPNKPIKIVKSDGTEWDGKLIGNGSVVNVKFALNEKKDGGLKPGIVAVQIWDHVPYQGGGDFPTKEVQEAAPEEDWSTED